MFVHHCPSFHNALFTLSDHDRDCDVNDQQRLTQLRKWVVNLIIKKAVGDVATAIAQLEGSIQINII